MIEEEMEKCTSDHNQGEESGYDTVVQHVTKRTQESKEWVWHNNYVCVYNLDLTLEALWLPFSRDFSSFLTSVDAW